MINFKAIGSRIRAMRKEKGITQESLAEMLSVSSEYVSRIENGTAHPSFSLIERLSDILNVDEAEIMFGIGGDDIDRDAKEKIAALSNEKREAVMKIIELML